jgi:mRNA-degrading endonuclease YafQ of YafQ-DinJ toxin-antitoxin module
MRNESGKKMKKTRNERFHPSFDDIDLPIIEKYFNTEAFIEFMEVLENEINKLHKYPNENTTKCKYPRLSTANYRKLKFHSVKKPKKNNKADMRLIYRYIEEKDMLQFLAVGLRHTEKPNIYDRANNRDDNEYVR